MRTYQRFTAVAIASASLLVAMGGCVGFYGDAWLAGDETEASFDDGGAAGGKGNWGAVVPPPSSSDVDAQVPVPRSDMYGAYCHSSDAQCVPGTSDCTPGGNPNMSSGSGGSVIACQITAPGGEVTATCNAVGSVGIGGLCTSAASCAAGLGCVSMMGVGMCRPYCCDDVEACPSSSYCALQPMAEAAKIAIPVCSPVKNCKLLENSGCAADEACTIVRKDGTTSCVTPGPGMRGEPCPCAAGYVCSPATSTCVKLCHIGKDALDCPDGGVCQGGVMLYPAGIGSCLYPTGK